MSYEKELKYLRKEFKKSEEKFREADREGYGTDADIWQDDMVNIGHQIHIHEQAAKAEEYEAKAKAFDDIEERFDSYKTGVKEDYEKDMTGTNLHLLLIGAAVKNHFDNFYVKSGEADSE